MQCSSDDLFILLFTFATITVIDSHCPLYFWCESARYTVDGDSRLKRVLASTRL